MLNQDIKNNAKDAFTSREVVDVMCKVLGLNTAKGTTNGNLTLLGGKGYYIFAKEQEITQIIKVFKYSKESMKKGDIM